MSKSDHSPADEPPFVSRSGAKLSAALELFQVAPAGWTCADFGCNVGGFTDCLLRRGAAKVYAVDTGYGTLAYTLRKDERVVVMERTNAMHVALPEAVDLVAIDVAWTPQHRILPNAMKVLRSGGRIITLIKPHYEANRRLLRQGLLDPGEAEATTHAVCDRIPEMGLNVEATIRSPIVGHKGNVEYLALLTVAPTSADAHPVQ